jgi:hypothetical protein
MPGSNSSITIDPQAFANWVAGTSTTRIFEIPPEETGEENDNMKYKQVSPGDVVADGEHTYVATGGSLFEYGGTIQNYAKKVTIDGQRKSVYVVTPVRKFYRDSSARGDKGIVYLQAPDYTFLATSLLYEALH